MAGAPLGNHNARNGRRWREAVSRALARATGKSVDAGLDRAADIFIAACFEGDLAAIKELGDRFDGKPAQALIGGDDDDPPITIKGLIDLVRPGS